MLGIMIGIFLILGLVEDHVYSASTDRMSEGWRYFVLLLASALAMGGFWWEVLFKG